MPKVDYRKKSIPWLRKKAGEHFRRYIRQRDADKPCISSGGKVEQAGHFYSAGHYPGLEFDEDNVHGQSLQDNYFKHGNLNEYRKNLEERIGKERLEKLDIKAGYYKRNGYKHDRFNLIEIIKKYKRC